MTTTTEQDGEDRHDDDRGDPDARVVELWEELLAMQREVESGEWDDADDLDDSDDEDDEDDEGDEGDEWEEPARIDVTEDAQLLGTVAAIGADLYVEPEPMVWYFYVDGEGCLVGDAFPYALGCRRPPLAELDPTFEMFGRVLPALSEAGHQLVFVLLREDGGDRGTFERAWHTLITTAAERHKVALRAVVALGFRRARIM